LTVIHSLQQSQRRKTTHQQGNLANKKCSTILKTVTKGSGV